MSMQIATQMHKLLNDLMRMATLLGLGTEVTAVMSALRGVETMDDLIQLYRTDVRNGELSIGNLFAVLKEGLHDINCTTTHCINRIDMVTQSPHFTSLHKLMVDKKKGSIDPRVYHPTCSAADFEKALAEFQSAMGENVAPKIEYALRKGKGYRCLKLGGVCKPIITNLKKVYTKEQTAAAKALVNAMKTM